MVSPTEPCALRSTRPLKLSTRDFSWGKGGRCVWLTTYHPCSAETSRKSGALIYPEPLGPPRPVAGDKKGVKENHEDFSQDSNCTVQYSNPVCSEYKSEKQPKNQRSRCDAVYIGNSYQVSGEVCPLHQQADVWLLQNMEGRTQLE